MSVQFSLFLEPYNGTRRRGAVKEISRLAFADLYCLVTEDVTSVASLQACGLCSDVAPAASFFRSAGTRPCANWGQPHVARA